MLHFNQVTIIGVGLIGGSLGMILRRKGLASRVVGVGRRVENLKTAVNWARSIATLWIRKTG